MVKPKTEEVTLPLKVFVYGTLKQGMPNNVLLEGCKLLRDAGAFGVLLHLGAYPGFLPDTTGMLVSGELWEVPTKRHLDELDQLEGHPHHFTRTKILLAGGEEAWTYVYSHYHALKNSSQKYDFDIITSGTWLGPKSFKVPFAGFFTEKEPPKTAGTVVAHIRIPGHFSGLVDCSTGLIWRDNYRAEHKPHLVHDPVSNTWCHRQGHRTPLCNPPNMNLPQLPAPPKEPVLQYVDPSDPGEVEAPARNVA